jgi:hypothetical protein
MKKIMILWVMVASVTIACAQKSPREKASGTVNGINVAVDYGAPSVRDRKVWGELVPYGKVWRAGANENTTITFDKNVTIAGKSLAAGKYGFFMIPNESGDWTAIFSKKNDAWGSNGYAESDDALRVNLAPKMASDNQEQLKFSVGSNGIDFAWEKARLSIPIK